MHREAIQIPAIIIFVTDIMRNHSYFHTRNIAGVGATVRIPETHRAGYISVFTKASSNLLHLHVA